MKHKVFIKKKNNQIVAGDYSASFDVLLVKTELGDKIVAPNLDGYYSIPGSGILLYDHMTNISAKKVKIILKNNKTIIGTIKKEIRVEVIKLNRKNFFFTNSKSNFIVPGIEYVKAWSLSPFK